MTEQKITPCLWFDFNAEEAVDHYLSIFRTAASCQRPAMARRGPARKGR